MKGYATVLIAALLALSGCSDGGDKAAAPGRQVRRVPVEVRPAESRTVTYSIQAVGSLQARETLRVPARVAGVVQDVAFQEGTYVTPDKVLARIDPERYALAAERAEASFLQAQAAAKEAEAALEKRRALHERDAGWVTKEELDNFTAQLDGARAALEAARAAADLARKDLKDSNVRVEYAGVIDQKLVDSGQYVTVGTVLATLIDTRRLKLSFRVSESESGRLAEKVLVKFRVKAIPVREFEGRLYHIGETADPATRMVECFAWVDNSERLLRPGFFADVSAEIESRPGSVVAPQTAVLPTERGYVAWVVRGEDEVERREVRLGLYTRDGNVEILDGLKAGEPLVVRGGALLAEGMRVSIESPYTAASGPAAASAPAAEAAVPQGSGAPAQ
jgi:multidrug efflux system membrane fusion protein